MDYKYRTSGTCARTIAFELEDGKVKNVKFDGGCNGNLKAIAKLLEGATVEEIEEKLIGNTCGRRPTSCTDQLARAVRKAYEELSICT